MTPRLPGLPAVLSFNAGFVDTAGFLALHGLFTAHVTGNFVTLGAALVYGRSGAVAKLLALPVFVATVMLVRLGAGHVTQRVMLVGKILLLTAFAVLALRFGPFEDADSLMAVVTGLTGVTAMAIQNALQRIHLGSAPPTTLMTGNTTQAALDLADLLRGSGERPVVTARLRRNLTSVGSFAAGCALGAVLFATTGMGVFLLPPVVAALALMRAEREGR